jgi:hypothetical protein
MPQRHTDSALMMHKVRAGESISSVAVEKCKGQDKDWTGIYAASRKLHLTARNANMITIGQQLAIDCRYLPDQAHFAPAPPPPPVMQASLTMTRSAAPVRHHYRPASSFGNVSPAGYSGFERCVITRESGGRSQVMNSSGHYGLYQFSASTWQAYGGSAAAFGHASASTQRQVFLNAMATAGGASNWSPYDGC